jgi:biotin carboxyl carrier protein
MTCEAGVAEVLPLGRGQYRIVDGARQRVAYAAGPPEACWVFLEGRLYVINTVRLERDSPDASAGSGVVRTSTQDDELALAAPMPATVASIHVAAGQDVDMGDLLVMLEAMKMELPIRAPRPGRIKAVACRRGELVQPGVPLVELE